MQIAKRNAFTMIEIMVVLGIIMFLMIFLVPRVLKYAKESKIKETELKLHVVKEAILQYSQDVGHAPRKNEGGLEALLVRPKVKPASENWKSPYLTKESELLDVWKDPFDYNCPPVKHKEFKEYEIISNGGSTGVEIADGD